MARLLMGSLVALALLSAACGVDGDDPAPGAPSGDGGGTGSSGGGTTTAGGSGVGTITVGDKTWVIVPSGKYLFAAVPGSQVTVVAIAGHAENDESIKIVIGFDPRDVGLAIAVQGTGGDPSWFANNETFPTVQVGASSIRAEGMFSNVSDGPGTAAGSFEVRC